MIINKFNNTLVLPKDYLNYDNKFIDEKNYDYFSTCVLITNTNNMYNLIDYIYWHLYVCNFEHIVIISNNNDKNIQPIKEVIKLFETDRIEFMVNNDPLFMVHNRILDTSTSKYVMFIDDDEYLYISDKFADVNELLCFYEASGNFYKFSVNWIHFFNNTLIDDFDNSKDACLNTFNYYYLPPGYKEIRFNLIKTIYKTNIRHHVFSDCSPHIRKPSTINILSTVWNELKPGTLHNALSMVNKTILPSLNLSNGLLNYNYDNATTDSANIDVDVFLAHYKYTSLQEINNKLFKSRDNISIDPESYKFNYSKQLIMEIYDSLNATNCVFTDVMRSRYNNCKDKILSYKEKI